MKLDPDRFYKVLAPRPVILVSTEDLKGRTNAAPFSFVMPVSIAPPLVAFASDPGHDTVKNIRKTGEFVVNIPSKGMLKKLWVCRQSFPYGVSEIERAGLSARPSLRVKPPRIRECIAHFECRLFREQGAGDHLLIIGRVVEAAVDERCFGQGRYQLKKALPLLHIGAEEFTVPGRVLRAR